MNFVIGSIAVGTLLFYLLFIGLMAYRGYEFVDGEGIYVDRQPTGVLYNILNSLIIRFALFKFLWDHPDYVYNRDKFPSYPDLIGYGFLVSLQIVINVVVASAAYLAIDGIGALLIEGAGL